MRGFGDRGKHTLKTLETESPKGFGFLVYWLCCIFAKIASPGVNLQRKRWFSSGVVYTSCLLTSGQHLKTCHLLLFIFVIVNIIVYSVCPLNNAVVYVLTLSSCRHMSTEFQCVCSVSIHPYKYIRHIPTLLSLTCKKLKLLRAESFGDMN